MLKSVPQEIYVLLSWNKRLNYLTIKSFSMKPTSLRGRLTIPITIA